MWARGFRGGLLELKDAGKCHVLFTTCLSPGPFSLLLSPLGALKSGIGGITYHCGLSVNMVYYSDYLDVTPCP